MGCTPLSFSVLAIGAGRWEGNCRVSAYVDSRTGPDPSVRRLATCWSDEVHLSSYPRHDLLPCIPRWALPHSILNKFSIRFRTSSISGLESACKECPTLMSYSLAAVRGAAFAHGEGREAPQMSPELFRQFGSVWMVVP